MNNSIQSIRNYRRI